MTLLQHRVRLAVRPVDSFGQRTHPCLSEAHQIASPPIISAVAAGAVSSPVARSDPTADLSRDARVAGDPRRSQLREPPGGGSA